MISTKTLTAFVTGAIFVALLAACDTATNTNTNTNLANNNANVNGNVTATPSPTANTNRGIINANITREEYEKTKDTIAEEAKRLGRTIGSGASDGYLWTKTRAVLATAEDLRDSTIHVDVENGVVTLTGTVATPAQKTRAGAVAKGVDGVTSVKNNLTVKK
jgi:hypothetical protein